MSGSSDWNEVSETRAEWHQTDEVLNDLREVHAKLGSLHQSLVRTRSDEQGRQAALAAIDRLGAVEQAKLSFLTEPVLPEDRSLRSSFRHGRTVTPKADDVAKALESYADGGSWDAVDGACAAILAAPDRSMGIDTVCLSELVTLFELAVEAGIRRREQLETALQEGLSTAYDEVDEPLGPLDEQPVALLPVRLETRFVDEMGDTEGPRKELLVRVYPDQIHTDSHEEELTEKEIIWGKNFWATMWYARHPDPTIVEDNPEYLKNRLPNQRLRERVAGIDPAAFSDDHAKRYRELEERAWQQLLDRFDRERAGYIIHALGPTDEELATDLLTEPPEAPTAGDGGEDQEEVELDNEVDAANFQEAVEISEEDMQVDAGLEPVAQLPQKVSELTFPSVPRRPQQWTKQARAKLLPDRWIAVAEWEDHTGQSHQTAIAGDPIREPLPVGPSAESVAQEALETDEEEEEGFTPDGTEWMTDFDAALDVGMGLRLPLTGLSGFDPERGFTRLSVLGVRSSVDPVETGGEELAELLDAHHYTDGLSFMPQGTPTNNHKDSAGQEEEFAEGLSAEVSPPLVENGDLSDGDLLARALSIDPDEEADHVFANVANADSTEQRDARHMNSALWPATLGYTMEHLYIDNEVVGNPPLPDPADYEVDSWSVETPDREDLETEMLWLDAYRRHFIRYVRARGPFPTLQVGNQPYGVLPATPIETDRDLSLIDPDLIADLGAGQLDVEMLEQQGTSVHELAAAGAEPTKLVEAGANPDELADAGVDPRRMVSGGVDPEEAFDAAGLVPDSLLQDGIGVRSTSRVTEGKLESEGVASDDLEAAGITPRALARGEVTDEQLEEAGVTTEQIASIMLPEKAQALGLTPSALERAGVSPATLLDGEFSDEQIQRLGLTTRGVADAVLPQELRDLGVTPKTIEDADITPRDLLNGEISPQQLRDAGIDTETVAEALLPDEAMAYGITPDRIAAADITAADLFNGDVSLEQLEAAGFDINALQAALLPDAFQEAGITAENLLDAGITPDAVMNGLVTPEDLIEAGLTPTTLAEAGVLPDAVSDVSQVITDLIEAGLDPMTLVERGLTPDALVDAGVTPQTLIDAGLAPKRLVDAGVDVVEIAAGGAASGGQLLDAGVDPAKLARAGVTVADLAGGDVPVKELVTTGTTALELVTEGADALDLASEGARPSSLREANVDAGTLREAGKAAGSLRTAGYSAEELLEAGYAPDELLNGGFAMQELTAAGINPQDIDGRRRDVSTMLAAGHTPAELKHAGFAPEQLLEGGLETDALVEAGYTAGELVDAGLTTEQLLEAGLDVADLRAADVDTEALLGAGLDLATLREHGATAEELIAAGHDPEELVAAGFAESELEVAGVDVDALLEDAAEDELSTEDTAEAAVEGLQYAATVLEEPEQAQRDTYRFSFDPAIPTGPPRKRTAGADDSEEGPDDGSAADGGVQAGTVPIVRPLSIDDKLDGRLNRQLRQFGTAWQTTAKAVPFGHNLTADGLVDALGRSAISRDVRQRTMLYSGEMLEGRNKSSIFAYAVTKYFLKIRAHDIRSSFEDAGIQDCDPRIGYFAPLDVKEDDTWVQNLKRTYDNSGGREKQNLWWTVEAYLNTDKQGVIPEHDLVDADIGKFIDVLLDSSVKEIHRLGEPIDALTTSAVDPSQLDAVEEEGMTSLDVDVDGWDNLDTETQRNRIVRAIEAAEDPVQLGQRMMDRSLASYQRIDQLARNTRYHGDSGVLRSMLRILLQHGTLQEYLTARRRLGLSYDDLPSPWFDPAYADREADTMMDTLNDPVPDPLKAHPDISWEDDVWYRDALEDAAASYSSTTSIDPRISEFTDSVQYLAGVDPSDLSTLLRETLDLANHRIDAWWTSVATKRLLELREAQGTIDPDGTVDHEAWDGAGSDVPRATVDPALVGATETDDESIASLNDDAVSQLDQEDLAQVDDQESSQIQTEGIDSQSASRQYDPAALDEGEQVSDAEFDTSGPSADGGMDPTEEQFDQSGHIDQSGGQFDQSGSTTGGSSSGQQGGEDGEQSFDPSAVNLDAAKRVDPVEPGSLDPRAATDPGLYVGGYGFVENLSADIEGRDDPEYIHAPSEQHATTAAILKSGADAHDADEGENVLALDLSAERIRAGLRLIRGVRRGQALPELLGYRFERRMHEATRDYNRPDLMQYLDVLRKEFPRRVGDVKKPDENNLDEERLEELAARNTVDGLALLEGWDKYPFKRGDNLPGTNSDAYEEMNRIVSDLGEDIDAAGDMLVAESVHQIGQGNFERAGGSVDALATGAQLPDPDVIETPRSGTGLTHRQCLLIGDTDAPVGTPRGDAAPSLATWVNTMLPDLSDVECAATYHWEEPVDAGQSDSQGADGNGQQSSNGDQQSGDSGQQQSGDSGEQEVVEREASTSLSLDVLDLGPLDVLLLFGANREETRSELEQRLAYHLIRNRPTDPAVPVDAEVELELTETDGDVSVAELLELARSLREFVQSTRPATAKDLAHPSDFDGEGYTQGTADALTTRANDAQDTLYEVAESIDERLALFDAEHALEDGTQDLSAVGNVASDGGPPATGSWENMDGPVMIPKQDPVLPELAFVPQTLPEKVDDLADAVRTVDEEVPLETVETVANDIDSSTIRSELSSLLADLPAGSAAPDAARADHRVESDTDQSIAGQITLSTEVPDVDPGADDDADGDGGDTTGDDGDDSSDSDSGDGADDGAASSGPIAWGEVDPAGEDIMGVAEMDTGSMQMDEVSEFDTSEVEYVTDEVEYAEPVAQPVTGVESVDESAADDEIFQIDWSDTTVTVRVWGTDGTSWFESEKSTDADTDGSFDVRMDFSAVQPGTSFQIAAISDGTVLYSATGRVVDDGDLTADAQSTLRSDCETLRRLVWLHHHRSLLSADEGPSAALIDNHEDIDDWQRLRDERDAVDPATSTVTSAEQDAVTALADMESFDPAAVPESTDATTEPVERLGLDRIVDLTGETDTPDGGTFWVGANKHLTGVRARIDRTLADPSLYNEGADPRLLKYDQTAATTLYDMKGGEVTAAYLDAYLAQPAWTLRYLDREMSGAAVDVTRNLTAWLYEPTTLDRSTNLASQLRDLAAAARKLPALTALFEGLPRGEAATKHEAFADHLDTLANSLGSGSSSSFGSSPEAKFDSTASTATSNLRDAVSTERSTISEVVSGPHGDEAFRKIALEQLRDTMTVAASYGVYGGTPSEPDGGSHEVTTELLDQARALLERLRSRLTESAALDPRIDGTLSNHPVAQRVETQTDRLERLFGDGFTVLPPFSPTNREELTATFTDDGLVPNDRSLAAETWLQRSAPHRDRVQKFREARSYAEAIAASLTPSLTVGQVPYKEDDTWVGAEGVDPDGGRISIVAQFGPDITPSLGGQQVVGLSVDEWTETVPSQEETTGVALNYDDPGNRAPQSILLVPPPADGGPSLDHLAATVAETADYAKRRSLTLDDFEDIRMRFDPPFGLFPALNMADRNASTFAPNRGTPMVDFGMLDWYDKTLSQQIMYKAPTIKVEEDDSE